MGVGTPHAFQPKPLRPAPPFTLVEELLWFLVLLLVLVACTPVVISEVNRSRADTRRNACVQAQVRKSGLACNW